jgi:hypothetical protein
MMAKYLNFYHLFNLQFLKNLLEPEPGRKPRRMTAPAVIHPTLTPQPPVTRQFPQSSPRKHHQVPCQYTLLSR